MSLPVRECGLKYPQWYTAKINHQSLPVRECGLKYYGDRFNFTNEIVTPCAGVWIEISQTIIIGVFWAVTPCAGVWIEILQSTPPLIPGTVTPCAGVWIEI